MKDEIYSYAIIALLEVEKINIKSSRGFKMKFLVKNGLASKRYMADLFTPKKVKSYFLHRRNKENSNVH